VKSALKLIALRRSVQAKIILELFHHRGTEDTEVTSTIDEPVNSASEHFDIEIDQKTKPKIGQLEIGEKLSPVDRKDPSNSLYFHYYRVLHNNVESIPTIQLETSVMNGQGNLLPKADASQRQLPTKTTLIRGL
jgi:hypothetical protein